MANNIMLIFLLNTVNIKYTPRTFEVEKSFKFEIYATSLGTQIKRPTAPQSLFLIDKHQVTNEHRVKIRFDGKQK